MATDRVAVVTAGGSGMGADAARKLAEEGFHIAVLSPSGRGDALAAQLRYGRASEVSELIAFLAGERSSYITGQNIRIDGGITRSV